MKAPSRDDWGEIDRNDLDANWAFKQFFGKSFEEAEGMFQSNALYYQEDLQSMPAVVFNFYAPALANYIVSLRAKGDSDGASSFLHLLSWMLQTRREIIFPKTEQLLLSAAEQIASRQDFYEAEADIYGKFSELHAQIQNLVRRST